MKSWEVAISVGRIAKNRKRTALAMLILLSILANLPASVALLVFYDENGYEDKPAGLYNFDTNTGTVTFRAAIPERYRFFGMDVRPSEGTVFAVNTHWDSSGSLWTIDIDTGATTLIGPTGVNGCVGLAFDPFSGDLYGLSGGDLYSVDTSTGAFTLIGDGRWISCGLSFSPGGQLFAFNLDGDLYTVDPLTVETTAVGGRGNPIPAGTISEDSTFTRSGELYATDYRGGIYRTDTITGNGVLIGTTGMDRGLLGLIEVPEPATVFLLGLGGLAVLRKSRA